MHVCEEGVHDAAGEERDCRATATAGARAGRRGSRPAGRCSRGQHPEGEGQPAGTSEGARDPRRTKPTGHREERAPEEGSGEDAQDDPGPEGESACANQPTTRRRQAFPVGDAGRAGRLAAAASEAAVEMIDQRGVGGRDAAGGEGAHEDDATPGAVVLVSRGEVRRAGGQTKPAVHAGGERFEDLGRGLCAHDSIPSIAITNRPDGSNTSRSWATSGPTPSR